MSQKTSDTDSDVSQQMVSRPPSEASAKDLDNPTEIHFNVHESIYPSLPPPDPAETSFQYENQGARPKVQFKESPGYTTITTPWPPDVEEGENNTLSFTREMGRQLQKLNRSANVPMSDQERNQLIQDSLSKLMDSVSPIQPPSVPHSSSVQLEDHLEDLTNFGLQPRNPRIGHGPGRNRYLTSTIYQSAPEEEGSGRANPQSNSESNTTNPTEDIVRSGLERKIRQLNKLGNTFAAQPVCEGTVSLYINKSDKLMESMHQDLAGLPMSGYQHLISIAEDAIENCESLQITMVNNLDAEKKRQKQEDKDFSKTKNKVFTKWDGTSKNWSAFVQQLRTIDKLYGSNIDKLNVISNLLPQDIKEQFHV